jgi:nucleoside-diphosphate-sugar epimerase
MKFTVLGASGFIGSNMVAYLKSLDIPVYAPPKQDPDILKTNLGNVIYCIGLTADFRKRPFDTVEAHVSYLKKVLSNGHYDSFTYLSSTRVYSGSNRGDEGSLLQVNSTNPSDLYNLSKLLGEAICLATCNPKIRVARLSNVYGENFDAPDFLYSLIRSAVDNQKIVLQSPINGSKDYIFIDDVVKLLYQITLTGRSTLYNVASGVNISNAEVIQIIQEVTNFHVETIDGEEKLFFPPIMIQRICNEFAFQPSLFELRLQMLVRDYKIRGGLREVDC